MNIIMRFRHLEKAILLSHYSICYVVTKNSQYLLKVCSSRLMVSHTFGWIDKDKRVWQLHNVTAAIGGTSLFGCHCSYLWTTREQNCVARSCYKVKVLVVTHCACGWIPYCGSYHEDKQLNHWSAHCITESSHQTQSSQNWRMVCVADETTVVRH